MARISTSMTQAERVLAAIRRGNTTAEAVALATGIASRFISRATDELTKAGLIEKTVVGARATYRYVQPQRVAS